MNSNVKATITFMDDKHKYPYLSGFYLSLLLANFI
jgi:hypothetical protein